MTFSSDIDPAALERLKKSAVSGNPEQFVREILTIFIDRLPLAIENLHKYADEQNYSKVGRVAHQLKGSSLSVGANRLAQYCDELEQAISESNPKRVDHLIDAISQISHQVTENFQTFLQRKF